MIEEVKGHNLSTMHTFVDFKKAVNSINRDKMSDVLLAYWIPSQIVKGIKGLYIDTVAQLVTEDGNTNFFPIVAGVRQSDTLALYLFIIILDYVIRIKMTKDDNFGRHCPAVHLTDADFTDDIVLLSNKMNVAQALLNAAESAAQSGGLVMNVGKTKFMCYEQCNGTIWLYLGSLYCTGCSVVQVLSLLVKQ